MPPKFLGTLGTFRALDLAQLLPLLPLTEGTVILANADFILPYSVASLCSCHKAQTPTYPAPALLRSSH